MHIIISTPDGTFTSKSQAVSLLNTIAHKIGSGFFENVTGVNGETFIGNADVHYNFAECAPEIVDSVLNRADAVAMDRKLSRLEEAADELNLAQIDVRRSMRKMVEAALKP